MHFNTRVKAALLALLLIGLSTSSCDYPYQSGDYRTLAYNDAVSAGVNADLFVKQIDVESQFNPDALSPEGAIGIAQFEPTTAAVLGIDPHDPVASLNGAARLMARYVNKYGDYRMALAAYNCGENCLQNAIDNYGYWYWGVPAQTRNYIEEVMA